MCRKEEQRKDGGGEKSSRVSTKGPNIYEQGDASQNNENLEKGKTCKEHQNAHNQVFRHMATNLVMALLLFYLNSGCECFGHWKYFSEHYNKKEIDLDNLLGEINDEGMTEEEVKNLYKEFHITHEYFPDLFSACATCGICHHGKKVTQVALLEEGTSKFKFSDVDQIIWE